MTTPAARLSCPTCGAPADAEAHTCAYCGTQLATTACPSCFGMVFRGSEFFSVIDICKQHGIWFDRDELRRVIEFIRAGGIDKAREKQLEKLDRERARLEQMRSSTTSSANSDLTPFAYANHDEAVDLVRLVGGVLRFFVR